MSHWVRKQPVLMQNSLRKAAVPLSERGESENWNIDSANRCMNTGPTDAGTPKADLQLQLWNAEFQKSFITL